MTAEKNIALFTEFGVMSEVELHAREEIMYENYSDVIDIEAKTMVDIANKKIIPAIERYVGELCAIARDKAAVFGSRAGTELERTVLMKLSRLARTAYEKAERLKDSAETAAEIAPCNESAFAYKEKVVPLMNELRAAVDEAEGIVPADLWPLPSYGDMTMKQ